MSKIRLDQALVQRGLYSTRSQAENHIKLGFIEVDGKLVTKPGHFVATNSDIRLLKTEKYVSRAGFKIEAANNTFKVNFKDKTVLDIGSSTGGFTDYALQQGAKKIIAVDVGTDQLHASLRQDPHVEVHEKTDIRGFKPSTFPDVILIDVSFISLREILPHIAKLASPKTKIIALFKPQFEATKEQINRGIIKNSRVRRELIQNFEKWVQNLFKIMDKVDSQVAGAKGNEERFFLLKALA